MTLRPAVYRQLCSLLKVRGIQDGGRACFANHTSTRAVSSHNLKEAIRQKISEHRRTVEQFRKEYGSSVVQEVTVDMIYGGMRSMKAMVTETSVLDPKKGIRFRGYTIPEIKELLPKAPGGAEPLPEAIWWLLCTGEVPTETQVASISKDWAARSALPDHIVQILHNFPPIIDPMTQFVSTIAALSSESSFAKIYLSNVPKSEYWEYVYEDAMDLLAKLPAIAAIIYRNLYREGSHTGVVNHEKDWSANLASMLGYEDPAFSEMLRMYLTIHSDHEGGNVSAHASRLVGSTLSDPYLSFSAAMAGLSGPLHGRVDKEVVHLLLDVQKELGPKYTSEALRTWVWKNVTGEQVRNRWPNVDAHSGVLLYHYGMTETSFHTVLFGVSRALGCLAQLIWDRGMELPVERPESYSTEGLMALAAAASKTSKPGFPRVTTSC
ncbi:hypothetical protein AB6A40_005899 [Gnathostoma spinigerum]|uniref:Citrate synthase n=1 Tax=Gnathostoma spinigerum TaxID=75299 RepID=A0ABD6EGR9_9BILA